MRNKTMNTSFLIVLSSFVRNRARAVAALVALGCALCMPSSLWGQNYWTQSGNSLYPNSTGWNLGIGITTPAFTADLNSCCDTVIGLLTGGGRFAFIGQGNGLFTNATGATASDLGILFGA